LGRGEAMAEETPQCLQASSPLLRGEPDERGRPVHITRGRRELIHIFHDDENIPVLPSAPLGKSLQEEPMIPQKEHAGGDEEVEVAPLRWIPTPLSSR